MKVNDLFNNSPIALWEKDMSAAKLEIDKICESIGVENLENYLETHHDFVTSLMHSIVVIDLNPKAVQLLKAESKEQALKDFKRNFTQELYQTMKREFIAIAKDEAFEEESVLKNFNGELVPIFLAVNHSVDSNYASTILSAIDLRSYKANHDEVHNISQKYQNLIELTGTAFMILNPQFEIIDTNAKFRDIIELNNNSDIIGTNPRCWVDPQSVEIFDKAILEISKGNSPRNIEVLLSGKGGNNLRLSKSIWLNIILSRVDNGKSIVFCLVQDISDKKSEEMRRYIKDQKRKDSFKQNVYKIREQLNSSQFDV